MQQEPLFISDTIKESFSKEIRAAILLPEVWDEGIFPANRLFLYYGQPGLDIKEAVLVMAGEAGIPRTVFAATQRNIDNLEEILKKATQKDLLVIENGHLLKLIRAAYALNSLTEHFKAVIVITDEVPDKEHAFYAQFDRMVVSGVPSRDFHRQLFDYYFGQWERHWPNSTVDLSEKFREELAIAANFCTPDATRKFCRKIFDHIFFAYPEKNVDLNEELVKSFFSYPFGSSGVPCIIDENPQVRQNRINPLAFEITENVEVPRRKRAKSDVAFE